MDNYTLGLMFATIKQDSALIASGEKLIKEYEIQIDQLKQTVTIQTNQIDILKEKFDLSYPSYYNNIEQNKDLTKQNAKLQKKVKFWKKATIVTPVIAVGILKFVL